MPNAYTPQKNRYDQFPWQVQAYRQENWVVVSCHISESRAYRGLAQIRKCTPNQPQNYRIAHCTSDNFIWANPENKTQIAS